MWKIFLAEGERRVKAEADKAVIKGNFSKSAVTYDDHAEIQRKCAEKLIDMIDLDYFSRILEIGCGTGTYTSLLFEKFHDALITAVDISREMVDHARRKISDKNILFQVSDAEKLYTGEKCDLVTSNASFQWFEDVDMALSRFSGLLEPGGTICFSIYGPETFRELKEVIRTHFGPRCRLSSNLFAGKDEISESLGKYFRYHEVLEENFSVSFSSIWDFLQDIKKSGCRGAGLGKGAFLGKYALRDMERTYVERFGGITATHNVYFCKAEAGR
jgi:malonyl-CoA O-methyltransferase